MSINEHDVEKFLAGELPNDHPAWSQTAAFTQRLGSVYPPSSGTVDAARLAAVVDEARQVRTAAALQRNVTPIPMKRSRLVLAVASAAVVAVASGVGMAVALTGNVGQSASELKLQLPVAPASVAPVAPAPAEPEVEADDEMEELKADPPKVKPQTTVAHKTQTKPATHKSEDSHEDEHESEHEDEHEDDD